MVVTQGSILAFSVTPASDYTAVVLGPDPLVKKVRAGEPLPSDAAGFYTLAIQDAQLRQLEADLVGEHGLPPTEHASGKGRVTFGYEVR